MQNFTYFLNATIDKKIWHLAIWQSSCLDQFNHSRIEVLQNCSAFVCVRFSLVEGKFEGTREKLKHKNQALDNLPKKLNVLGKKKEKGRRPVEGLNYAKLLRYSISHMTNLRNQTLDMLLKVCLRFQFQVGHPIDDTGIPRFPRLRFPQFLIYRGL